VSIRPKTVVAGISYNALYRQNH